MKKAKKKPTFKHGDVSFKIGANPIVNLDCDLDRYSNGFMHMMITDVKISQGEEKLGSVSVDIQGLAVHAHIGSRSWSISIKELWPLFLEADERYQKESA